MLKKDLQWLKHPLVRQMFENNRQFYETIARENYPIERLVGCLNRQKEDVNKVLAFGILGNFEEVVRLLNKYHFGWRKTFQYKMERIGELLKHQEHLTEEMLEEIQTAQKERCTEREEWFQIGRKYQLEEDANIIATIGYVILKISCGLVKLLSAKEKNLAQKCAKIYDLLFRNRCWRLHRPWSEASRVTWGLRA